MKKVTKKDKPKNLQDVFNRVWDTFVVEEQPVCTSPLKEGGVRCVYRRVIMGKRLGCAIGCCLPDDLARKADKKSGLGTGIEDILDCIPEIKDWFEHVEGYRALARLQSIHDGESGGMEGDLRGFAKDFKLKIP